MFHLWFINIYGKFCNLEGSLWPLCWNVAEWSTDIHYCLRHVHAIHVVLYYERRGADGIYNGTKFFGIPNFGFVMVFDFIHSWWSIGIAYCISSIGENVTTVIRWVRKTMGGLYQDMYWMGHPVGSSEFLPTWTLFKEFMIQLLRSKGEHCLFSIFYSDSSLNLPHSCDSYCGVVRSDGVCKIYCVVRVESFCKRSPTKPK